MQSQSHIIITSIVAVADTFTLFEERMALRGVDTLISCLVDATIEQNNTILWALFYPYNMLISETQKYTLNETELTVHNVTIEDEGDYACYSKEIAIVYTVIDVIVTCKYFLAALLTVSIILFQGIRK